MQYPYYPGCSLFEKAAAFNESALEAYNSLGIELKELPEWQCCGAVYPLSSDGLFPLAAPLRNLVQAERMSKEDEVSNKMVTACSACFNVHKRVNYLADNDQETLDRINSYNREDEYHQGVEVVHLLEVLQQEVGFAKLSELVKVDLSDLKVAPYYGCLLLRPREELEFDDPENPKIFEDFLAGLGSKPVDFPHRAECCGAYATLQLETPPEIATRAVVDSASERGAELIVASCPLCHFNLQESQQRISQREPGFSEIPVIYFTELLQFALGLSSKLPGFDMPVK